MPTLLFVENDKDDYKAFGEPLAELGWELTLCKDIESAYAVLKDTVFDVAILDRGLKWRASDEEAKEKSTGGDQILKHVAMSYPSTCVIMLTNLVDSNAAARDIRWGAYEYLDKAVLSAKDIVERAALLNEICRRGMRHQLARGLLKEMTSVPSLAQLYLRLKDECLPKLWPDFPSQGMCFQVLICATGGALVPLIEQENAQHLTSDAILDDPTPFWLHETREQVLNFDWWATPSENIPGTQLLIPLCATADNANRDSLLGLAALEFEPEHVLDWDDVAILLDISMRISDSIVAENRTKSITNEASRYAAVGLAERIRSPLDALGAELEATIVQLSTDYQVSEADTAQLFSAVRTYLNDVNDTLELIRFLAGDRPVELKACDLRQIVTSVAGELQSLAVDAGCEIHISSRNELVKLPKVQVDIRLMHSVIKSLITSSIIAITQSESTKGKSGFITVQLDDVDGASVRLRLSDNGPMIPLEQLPFVFNRYDSAQTVGPRLFGEGDLLSVRRIIQDAFKGEIDLKNRSQGQSGVTYTIRLPSIPSNLY